MNRFIGLLDSGMGGLTVLNQIIASLPDENTVYFGDMGRAPYGSRSPEVIKRYSEQIVRYLTENYDLKLIVVACHTVSATSLDHLRTISPVPTVGMIESVPQKALESTKNGRIGVIGTRSTIRSGVYQRCIHDLDAGVKVYPQDCPLFIHLVEEGWAKEPATRMIVGEYLANLKHAKIDTLILGCTHYPVLAELIQAKVGRRIRLVDSAVAVADQLSAHLEKTPELAASLSRRGRSEFYISDVTPQFEAIAQKVLNRRLTVLPAEP